ncbi:MAG: hypothetical protein KAR56_01890 [Thermoplasmata archaeon]|nr:hypothetical protein [Thermoplasmata archaeon]
MSPGKRLMSNAEQAAYIGLLAGIFMIIAGVTGAATWSSIGQIIVEFTGIDSLGLAFQILAALGSIGGLLVILGACWIGGRKFILFKKRNKKAGSILISIGTGFGLLGFIIFAVLILISHDPAASFMGAAGIGFIGLVLSIIARRKIK